MSVQTSLNLVMTSTETLSAGVDGATNPAITHDGFNLSGVNLSATSTPPVSIASYQTYALVAGAKTIDLTALEGVNDVTQDCTGLKLQGIVIENPSGNNTMTVGDGAANGYQLFGSAVDVQVPAGSTLVMYFVDTLPDVAAGAKNIDISGTLTESINIGMVLG